ncbi:helix-turn-helix domain-containing protein [Aquabacterium sp.]|uniref:helix-turn-helix domain-containing protein n=1 Tax=Aquabacterium sp. TaxID=1872578 RepID=UPI0035ADCB81
MKIIASSLRRRLEGEQLSVAAIVREVHLEIALALLQRGDLAVGEVAQMCGWASHSRFTAMFLQRWGVLPSVVRAELVDQHGHDEMNENGQSLVANG